MRFIFTIILLTFITGCGSTIQPSPSFVEIENFELQSEPDFVIRPKNEELRKFGYSDFCTYKPDVRSTDCGQFSSLEGYNLLVNKKGIFLDEDIVYWSSYSFFPVQLENGSKFYLSTYKNTESTPFESSEIIDNQNHTFLLSIVNKPIREGSTLRVKGVNLDFIEGVKLSNDKSYRLDTYRNLLSILQFFPDFTDDLTFFNKMHEKVVREDKFKKLFASRSAPFLFKNLNYSPSLSLQTFFTENQVSNRLKVQYSGSNWLFVERYEILAGGEVYKSEEINFSRDNSSRRVWEWHTVEVDSNLESLLNSIVKDSNSTIRFYGRDYYKDVRISKIEREEIEKALSLTSLLNNER